MSKSPFAPLYSDAYWYRSTLARYGLWIVFILSVIQSIHSALTGDYFTGISIIYACFSVVPLLFLYLKKDSLAIFSVFIGYGIIILIRAYVAKTAFIFFYLCLLIIGASILTNLRFTTIYFAICFIALIIYSSIGIFTWTQPLDPYTNLFYANTNTVILPSLILSYIISFIISKVLVGAMQNQINHQKYLQESEDALIDREKMNALRVLAGGIAHDFNNILTTIIGNIELIDFQANTIDENKEYLTDLQKAASYAKAVANQLLSFSRPVKPNQIVESPQNIVQEVADFTLHGKKSKAELHIMPDVSNISVDRAQIGQVLQNIILNADQAMPQGGTITISVENKSLSEYFLKQVPPGEYVCISITDQGQGITPDQMKQIFTPFYTTKLNGSGLGLAISQTIITNHGGYILVESESGIGSTFSIYLPAVSQQVIDKAHIDLETRIYKGKILILDDNAGILKIAQHMLTNLGFEVTIFSNSHEFIQHFHEEKKNQHPITCLIIDLTIPGQIGGLEILKTIRLEDPAVKIILSSGYSDPYVLEMDESVKYDAFLVKPYSKDELLDVLNKILEY